MIPGRTDFTDSAADGETLRPMRVFTDICVVPVSKVHQHVAQGGPIWPNFTRAWLPRHCRSRLAVDLEPEKPATARELREKAIWGGFLNPHFGHLVIEHLTRLPQSLRDRPDAPVLFTLPPGMTGEQVPSHVWQLLDWYGVAREQTVLVTEPLRVAELAVAGQPEMMGKVVPKGEYLGLLDAILRRNAPPPERNRLVYVSRRGLVAKGLGGHLGEGYLCRLLAGLGVPVVEPSSLPVARQMAIYAGAEVLVFAEGSAMLGRHVLGHLPQDIHVLRRRPGRDLCATQLAPRCRRLSYHPVFGRKLGARMVNGKEHLNRTVGTYDLPVLFGLFQELGLDLAPIWDEEEYRREQEADALGWMANCPISPSQALWNQAILHEEGITTEADLAPAHRAKAKG
jgi:hypothetical protein